MTESSEHNAEYCPWFIKRRYPFFRRGGLRWVNKYRVPLDEYPVRCRSQIRGWKKQAARLLSDPAFIKHKKSHEYGSCIITALHTGEPFKFSGSVLNTNLIIPNLPKEACVEVPIVADKNGLTPQYCGALPQQLAAYNMTSITPQLLTLKANETRKMQDLIMAVAMDPHTGAVLSLDKIEKMCRALYKRHRKQLWMPEYAESNDSRDADFVPENMKDVETI
jgi:alpha-galactosidase